MKLMEPSREVSAFLAECQGLRIGDALVETSAQIDVVDPSFDKPVAQVAMATAEHIDDAVAAARAACRGPGPV